MPFQVCGSDNHLRFLDDRDEVSRCPKCNVPTHPYEHGFPLKKKTKKDISNCYEGFTLLSPRAKDFLEKNSASPLEFFETGAGYFIVRPKRVVFEKMQYINRPVDSLCKTCGRFGAVHFNPLGILKDQPEFGPFDVGRSGLESGPMFQRNFMMIVGDELVKAMKKEKFKGACNASFEPLSLFPIPED